MVNHLNDVLCVILKPKFIFAFLFALRIPDIFDPRSGIKILCNIILFYFMILYFNHVYSQIPGNQQTYTFDYQNTDSSGLVSGLDSGMFLDFPDMGEVAIDSIFEQVSGRDENGDSLPRKLYNYFYSYKENSCTLVFNIKKFALAFMNNFKINFLFYIIMFD